MKTAVVGLGAIAPLHINGILECGNDIAALCDTDIQKCMRTNQSFGLSAACYGDFGKMLETSKIDAVHICTPHYLHAPQICAALKQGVHVLTEKPLAISAHQLDEIENAARGSSAVLGVCHQNRYLETTRYVKRFLEGKQIDSAYGSLVWQRDADYYASADWRGKRDTEGGGVLINQMLHTLDILQWVCGMPRFVTGRISNNSLKDIIEVEDTVFGLFETETNGSFIINGTNGAKYSFPVVISLKSRDDLIEVIGDNIIVNDKFLTKKNGSPIFGKEVWGNGHKALIADFYDCLKTDRRFGIDFYEGRKAVDLILALYSSNGEKKEIVR